jgi:hypothetical protein
LGSTDNVTWSVDQTVVATQGITTSNTNCLAVDFADNPSLLSVTAIGGQLGEVKNSIGVKSNKDGFGESCGRVDSSQKEQLSVALGTALDGYLMSAIDLDLELKFNAWVKVVFKNDGSVVHVLDKFVGWGWSDDGPDSKEHDNYRLFYRPTKYGKQILFDEVVLIATKGSFSLEGGSDGTKNGKLDPNTNNWSQFELVQLFDGDITCNEVVDLGGAEIGVLGQVTMLSLNPGNAGYDVNCAQLKNYNEDVTSESLLFAPVLAGSTARYALTLTANDQVITTDSMGRVTSLVMTYTDGGIGSPERPLLPCIGQPQFTEAWLEQADTGLFPADEFACYYDVKLTPQYQTDGQLFGTEVWSIFFEDDPKFSFG